MVLSFYDFVALCLCTSKLTQTLTIIMQMSTKLPLETSIAIIWLAARCVCSAYCESTFSQIGRNWICISIPSCADFASVCIYMLCAESGRYSVFSFALKDTILKYVKIIYLYTIILSVNPYDPKNHLHLFVFYMVYCYNIKPLDFML